jgi:hypothetical protein
MRAVGSSILIYTPLFVCLRIPAFVRRNFCVCVFCCRLCVLGFPSAPTAPVVIGTPFLIYVSLTQTLSLCFLAAAAAPLLLLLLLPLLVVGVVVGVVFNSLSLVSYLLLISFVLGVLTL